MNQIDNWHEIIIGIFTNIVSAVLVGLCTSIYEKLRGRHTNILLTLVGCFIVSLFATPAFFVAYLLGKGQNLSEILVGGLLFSILLLSIVARIINWFIDKRFGGKLPDDHWIRPIVYPIPLYALFAILIMAVSLILSVLGWISRILRYITF
jgi:uncharacterized protein involved in response to NO